MSLSVSSKFYVGDKVAPKGERAPQGTVLGVNDEDETVKVKWDGHIYPDDVRAKYIRVLPPSEVAAPE